MGRGTLQVRVLLHHADLLQLCQPHDAARQSNRAQLDTSWHHLQLAADCLCVLEGSQWFPWLDTVTAAAAVNGSGKHRVVLPRLWLWQRRHVVCSLLAAQRSAAGASQHAEAQSCMTAPEHQRRRSRLPMLPTVRATAHSSAAHPAHHVTICCCHGATSNTVRPWIP